jgi:hemolysin activation/secretion protein
MISSSVRVACVLGSGVAMASLFLAPPASAQTQQQVSLPSRQEITPPSPETEKPSGQVSVDSKHAIAPIACPFDNSPLKLTISTLQFTAPDGSALPPEVADSLAGVRPLDGEQPLREVCEVRDRANAALRRAGWVASVQIPPQQITGGTLRLNVVTAHIVEMHVRGSAGPYEALLRDRIAKIQALNPLNELEAERLLLLAGDIPGLEVQLSLRPAGTEQGAVIGDLSVTFRRFAVLANVQNENSRQTGRWTGYARAELYGLTGMGDVTYAGFSSTSDFKEQIVAQVGHTATLDSNGLTFGPRFTYAWSRPDLGALDFRTNTLITGFDLNRPLIRSLNSNLRASAGFDFVNQRSSVGSGNGAVPLLDDRLRVGYIGVDGDFRRLRYDGSTALSLTGSLQLRKGFDILDASHAGFNGGLLQSRVDGNSSAFVLRANIDGIVGIGPIFSLRAQGQAQWANDPLLNYEQYSVGNLTIGRGFDPGVSTGDRALAGHGEVRADLPIWSRIGTQVYGFYDHVYLRNLSVAAIDRTHTFRSVGGGARITLPGSMVLDLSYAHPLDRASRLDEERPSDRLLMSLTVQLRDHAR